MASSGVGVVLLFVVASLGALPARAQDEAVPRVDRRAVEIRTLDTPYTFTPHADKEAWLARARFLREQVLVSAGLWPMPEKGPLDAHVFGRIERGDYSVEKVYFESHPGLLRHRQPLPTAREDRSVSRGPLAARPLGLRPPRERRRRVDPGAVHHARAAGLRGLLVGHDRLQRLAARWTTASSTSTSPSGGSGRWGCTCGTASARWTSWSRSRTWTRAASPARGLPAAAPRPSC